MKQQQRKYYIRESSRNSTASSKNLHQLRKWKKLLKKKIDQENRVYTEVTRPVRYPKRRQGKTNHAGNNHKQNICERLR